MTGEYIPRDLVLLVIEKVFDGTDPKGEEQIGILKCHRIVREHPAADVAPVVRSRWMISSDGYYPYCEHCQTEPVGGKMTKYCPNCGAVMDGGIENAVGTGL